MTVLVGTTGLSSIYQGESLILKIYKGETLVWYYNHEEDWYYWEEDSTFQPGEGENVEDGGVMDIDRLLGISYEELSG